MTDARHVGDIITKLSGILKVRRMDENGAKAQLAIYREALVGELTREALEHAASRALKELEWMPTPAELFRFADGYVGKNRGAKIKAVALLEARTSRQLRDIAARLRSHDFPLEQIDAIPAKVREWAEGQRIIARNLHGAWFYGTPEALEQDRQDREAFTASLRGEAGSADYRKPPRCKRCHDLERILDDGGNEVACPSCAS